MLLIVKYIFFIWIQRCVQARIEIPFQAPANVLVLTYHRSGSSFVSELCATGPNSSYFFEPLFHNFRKDAKPEDATEEGQMKTLEGIFNCNPEVLEPLRQSRVWIVRKFGSRFKEFKEPVNDLCKNMPVKVVKTIRARIPLIKKIIDSGTVSNLKVVHLVRDPRARFNSITSTNWDTKFASIEGICQPMQEDLNASSSLNSSNYMLIKYEDVVKDPMAEAIKIFNFTGVNFNFGAHNYLKEHVGMKNIGKNTRKVSDYTTYRYKDFNPNHWVNKLDNETVQQINKVCEPILTRLDYKLNP